MIDIEDYWMGRDKTFTKEWTDVIQNNGDETVVRINQLLDLYVLDTGFKRPETWASGWRPAGVNANTSNAASHSKHITAQAGDIRDPTRLFAKWCNSNQDKLEQCELWMEDSRWCPTWVHLQTVPPSSGKRVYIPSSKPPLCEMP